MSKFAPFDLRHLSPQDAANVLLTLHTIGVITEEHFPAIRKKFNISEPPKSRVITVKGANNWEVSQDKIVASYIDESGSVDNVTVEVSRHNKNQ